jgi:hypothetical protein
MAIDFEALDYSDPCALLAAMRPAYYELIAGKGAQSVTFTAGNGTTKSVMFHRTDISLLSALITRLENECAEKQGKRRRYAVRAGGRIY